MRQLILLALILAACVQAYLAYPRMPNPMASHFNGAGIADGWSSPADFFTVMLMVEIACAACFLFTPGLTRLPDGLINLPNKDYWLAPERREQTLRGLGRSMLDFGIATQLLLMYAMHLSVQANLSDPPRLSSNIVWALCLYVVASLVWTVALIRKYLRVPA